MSIGLVGKKLGMTRMLAEDGSQVAVTVLQIATHEVLAHKTVGKHGYAAAVVGTVETEERKLNKPTAGVFKALPTEKFYRIIKEFRDEELPDVGTTFGAELFAEGEFVDVTGVSIGKGFAGPMKRHNFGGLRASHGVSISHRSHGSTGNRTEPGRVFKGKKMAGHMGARRVTVQNLKVYGHRDDLLLIVGAVPGSKSGWLTVKRAVKKRKR